MEEDVMIDLGTTASVTIGAPIEEVWNASTTPDLIKRWFFGVDTETDRQVGSPLVHRGEWQGKPYEDKGTILRFEPTTTFVHSHWSPASGMPDRPEHYQEVTWSLAERNGETTVTVSETNLPSRETKAISEESWKAVLNNLKELLET
ncbi:MAG: SRPBCC domain-containing protein [Actinomycetota bacterium]|nr:SRPBCC domain-containing protein [Actinomycetota bacterium]